MTTLCHSCHVRLDRTFPYCLHCGAPRKGAKFTEIPAPTLAVGGRAIQLVKATTTIGRDPANDVVIDHPSVSRRHAQIVRTPRGYRIEDVGSFNGTSVGTRLLRGSGKLLSDSAELYIGDIAAVFAQPREARLGSKTMIRPAQNTVLQPAAPTATEPLSVRPRRRSGWALKRLPAADGAGWVLRNTRTGEYLELTNRDAFLWEQLTTGCTVGDLLYAYSERYGELALPRIETTLRAFARVGLVDGLASDPQPNTPGRVLLKVLFGLQLSIGELDRLFGWMYRAFGWLFFTIPAVLLGGLTIVAGLAGFWVAAGEQQLFDVGGAGIAGAIAVGAGYLVALVIHEAAHALAVKSYGRKVTRAGFMLMLFMPFAFVDTSDMWFAGRRARIVVSLAGPLSTAAIAGLLALLAAFGIDPVVSGIAFQLAVGLYLNTLYNFNPLIPLDGYHVLSDLLRMPRLREEAIGYLFGGLWRDIAARNRPSRRALGLLGYGFAAFAALSVMMLVGYLAWESRLAELAEPYIGSTSSALVPIAFAALLLFPVWWSLSSALRRRLRARRERGRSVVAASAPAESTAGPGS